jgi:uncharacterized DUF497 family protein
MRFEWDEEKNRRNLAKHKISFETASSVFNDPQHLSVQDRFVEGEERWQTLGMVAGLVVIVAHVWEEEDGEEVIRLISARKATARERRIMRKIKSAQADEIHALRRTSEREIDTTDIPPAADWSKAVVGKFYRPIKKPLTIRLDADVLHWLKGQGRGYQTRINAILRNVMERPSSDTLVVRITEYGDFAA